MFSKCCVLARISLQPVLSKSKRGSRQSLSAIGVAIAATASISTTRAEDSQSEGWSYNWQWFSSSAGSSETSLRAPRWPGPARKSSDKAFTRAQVAECDGNGENGRILVTYKDGVYDVTDYLHQHPGGKFILSAAGGPVDSWWAYWTQHHLSPLVAATLERLRVGYLSDYIPEQDEMKYGGGQYAEEQLLLSRTENRERTQRICEMPYTSVTKCSALVGSYLTPNNSLYVRNHAPVPSVDESDADDHSITFCVEGEEIVTLSLAELKSRFSKVSVDSVMQCSGNRASDNISCNGFQNSGFSGSDDEFIGLGMLGNSRWAGLRLRDVLQELFPQTQQNEWFKVGQDTHVVFEGLDGYYSSSPLKYVMDPSEDCLLAVEMNGVSLSPDHGFPVRALLPGITGARHVKWLSRISVDKACDSPWIKHFYRDKPSLVPIQALPMNSVILSPEPGDSISADPCKLCVKGVAYNGGTDADIARVEVSANRGQSWQEARCIFEDFRDSKMQGDVSPAGQLRKLHRGWVRFQVELDMHRAHELGCGGPLSEIWCRAFNDRGEVQPERCDAHGGYLFNGYHKVPVVRR